jgi:peptidoglycan/LPS O-acetylase OafA/YrhL
MDFLPARLKDLPLPANVKAWLLGGLAANRVRNVFLGHTALYVALAVLLATQGVHTAYVLNQTPAPIELAVTRPITAIVIGLCAGLCALRWLPPITGLQRIGAHSYAIYLYHPIFIAGARLLTARFTSRSNLVFAAAVVAGIIGPIAMAMSVRRLPWAQLLLVGSSSSKSSRERREAPHMARSEAVADSAVTRQ